MTCLSLFVCGSHGTAFERPDQEPGSEGECIANNCGFEVGDEKPEGWKPGAVVPGVDYIWERKLGRTGTSSLCLRKTAERLFPIAQWSQSIARTGELSHLRVDCWVKAQKAQKAIIDVQFESEAGEWSHKWASYIGAKNAGDPPADHGWKQYLGEVEIPAGTKTIRLGFQIYGPGTVWFDDLRAAYIATPRGDEAGAPNADEPEKESAQPPHEDLRAGGDENKQYFLIGPKAGDAPARGYKLLVVLPGGDGSAEFRPFVTKILGEALPDGYVLAQLVAPKWSDAQAEQVVWPTRKSSFKEMKFATEEFISAVVDDVRKRHAIDRHHIFTLSWSSSGPAAYAASLDAGTPITGSLVAMSVFNPDQLPDLKSAKGKAYYILHSPQDDIEMRFPEAARDQLSANGAKTKLATYEGGHGWQGDVFGNIRAGIHWLEEQTGTRLSD
ncbi:MAG: hypothetical protein L0Y42_02335 [Phycisphaerales bacterium]|nr:hypothetical protein [Phycisphaerales bacterium]